MRYLVTARVKPGREQALAAAIEDGTLGAGSIAGGEYARNMECARRLRDGSVKWVEVCYCGTPLEEERPYWEEYFDLVKVQDAHARSRCKDLNGEEPGRAPTATARTSWKPGSPPGARCSSIRSEITAHGPRRRESFLSSRIVASPPRRHGAENLFSFKKRIVCVAASLRSSLRGSSQ